MRQFPAYAIRCKQGISLFLLPGMGVHQVTAMPMLILSLAEYYSMDRAAEEERFECTYNNSLQSELTPSCCARASF